MRCVVTGAAGFIGSSIVDSLLESGNEVIGIDSFVDYYPKEIKQKNLKLAIDHNAFTFIEADLNDLNLEETLEGIDVVFHQAAQAGVRASWGQSFSIYTDNNISATQKLLEAAKSPNVSKTLKRIVYASSSSVYGNAETLPTLETALPQPLSPYGVSKLAAEHLMGLYRKEFGVPGISLRYFTVYGPRQRPDMAFNRFITAGLKGEAITVYGDGEQTRDFTFIKDIVKANILAASAETTGSVFNIGGGSRVSLKHVISLIGNILGKPLEMNFDTRQSGDAKHTGADTTRAKKQLGFVPKTDLKTGLEAEAAYLSDLYGI